jgi:hypothetical protein
MILALTSITYPQLRRQAMNGIINVGLDVHKETIDVALADEAGGEVRSHGTIGGDLGSVDRLIQKAGERRP